LNDAEIAADHWSSSIATSLATAVFPDVYWLREDAMRRSRVGSARSKYAVA
jgi:hypothetical protein